MRQLITTLCLLLLTNTVSAGKGFDYTAIDERMPAGNGVLLIDWRGDFTAAQKAKLRVWLAAMCETVTRLHGELPRPEIRLALQPYPASSAVPFARVLRNTPEGVLFYINPDKPLADFVNDWTAYHELSHLFIPYPGMDDIWFSEGLARYYQNVLQYRAGLLTAAQATGKLRAGFERGRADTRNASLSLGELSPVMREQLAFMRVYWSGALYFLEADIELRNSTRFTLDDVLRGFGECCLTEERDWTGLELAAEFDRIAATNLFVPLYEQYEASMAIPAYTELLASPQMDAILPPAPESPR